MLRRFLALIITALTLAALLPLVPAALPVDAQARDDFAIANGWFFSQANGQNGGGALGYSVTNNDNVQFWTSFGRFGGVPVVGYPVTHRFLWKGFIVQANQKLVFQWRADTQSVAFVNILDELSAAGFDDWLLSVKQVPRSADWSGDAGLPFPQVVQRHQALLDQNPAIRQVYFAAPNPIDFYGLPMGAQDFPNVFVIRAQRAVFQQWKVNVPWASAGQVVIANGGDLGKEAGLYPATATAPQPPGVQPPLTPGGPTPVPATPTPVPAGACNGDELMSFNPANPTVGQQLFINVTSARPSTNVSLQGPFSPQAQGITGGGRGTIWSWVVVPNSTGQLSYNFTINGQVCTSSIVQVTQNFAPADWQTNAPRQTLTPGASAELGLRNRNGQPGNRWNVIVRVTAPNGSIYDADLVANAADWNNLQYPRNFRGAPATVTGRYNVSWQLAGGGIIATDNFQVGGAVEPQFQTSAPRAAVSLLGGSTAQLGLRNRAGQPGQVFAAQVRVTAPDGTNTTASTQIGGDNWTYLYYPRDFAGARGTLSGRFLVRWTIQVPGRADAVLDDEFTVRN